MCLPTLHVLICDVITYLQMKHICVAAALSGFYDNVELSDIYERSLLTRVTLVDEYLTSNQLCLCSYENPHPLNRPSPRGAQKKALCAGRERGWFWLACSAASETLTFLQGLHLELVSCSGCAGQGGVWPGSVIG